MPEAAGINDAVAIGPPVTEQPARTADKTQADAISRTRRQRAGLSMKA
jgi:hypothetical protein